MMSNLTPSNDILNLTPSKTNTTHSSSSKTKEQDLKKSDNTTQDDTESFLNSLLNSIEETNEFLPDHMKISKKEVVNEAMDKLQNGVFSESDKISIFESASFMQILSLLDKLKADTADIKLANLSTQLSQLVKTEANFNALKSASNLSELLNIAKDLGLNVKNIKVDRLLDLKATFPNLDKANFFKGAVDNVFKEIINNKISNVSKNLNHNLQNTTHTTSTHSTQKTNSKDSGSLLSQTLKNLDSILSSKESKHEKNDKVKSKIEEDVTDAKNTLKNIKNDEFAKNLTEELNIKDKKNQDNLNKDNNLKDLIKDSTKQDKNSNKELKDNASTQELTNLKDLNKENKDLNKDFNKELNKNQGDMQGQNKNLKNNNQNLNLDKNLNKEIVKDTQNLVSNLTHLTQKDFNLNKELKNNNKENKDIKQNFFDQKLNFENLNKTQVVQNKENNANFNNNTNKETFTQEQTKTHSENVDKNSLDELNSLVKDLNKATQNNARNITPKETLQYFSQDLKEAVDQYKAPITKLSITLNPNNLGEVEVTLVQRGNNLHINFNSNTNAMNLFIQNQAEFKNSLVNMGFTGLEMNFSDQGKREQNQNQGKNRSGYGFKDALDGKNESEKVNLELVLAKYF
ncbi:flagellar hook-length control protein FliK [Campylobacter coli]|nr:flagellar hook-length control protein FliK [Campylobacter coli]EHQ8087448.1 flagellar hook-length control protein FliK [Campylobacter coli]EIG8835312.1 flagellar hook-length control protein FliK [Campylobacter coli]EKF2514877.1 flagellar hook-length control protein FliK [Campylobacter coli]EKK3284914.1 flagellar hook-length control protein FliK [Campylobacter coli]